MSRTSDGRWAPGAATLGLSLVVPGVLLVPVLPMGGLAPIAVAAVVTALVAVPAASAEWRAAAEHDPALRAIGEGVGDLAALLVVAAASAGLVAGLGPIGWLLVPAVWLLAAVFSRSPAAMLVPAALALLLGGGSAVQAAVTGPAPWTLLEAHWETWASWLGPALVAGLWMGGAGTAEWTLGPVRRPGESRAPWAGAGAGLLLITALAAREGVRFESALGPAPVDGIGAAILFLAASAGAATLLRRRPPGGARTVWWARLVVGGLATLWLAGPAAGTLAFGWSTALPLALLGSLLLVARRQHGAVRVPPLVAAGAALLAVVLEWRGLPRGMLDAGAAAITLAAGFWLVATRAVLSREAT